jgi:hypothetical protein
MRKSNDALRRKWISYWRGWYEAMETGRRDYPPIPEELHDLRCGAKTRAGTPCKMQGLYYSGRCKLHGGLSTGPKSEAGKFKSAQNSKRMRTANEPREGLLKLDIDEQKISGDPPVSRPKPTTVSSVRSAWDLLVKTGESELSVKEKWLRRYVLNG